MSCICQYFVHSKDGNELSTSSDVQRDCITAENGDQLPESSAKSDISATELAAARAENWLLNKNLTESYINIENLESLVKTIMDKQNVMLTEMYHLKRLNKELEDECRLQRDYHAMERNAIIKELQEVKDLLQQRSKSLDETLENNRELMSEAQDANEKVYVIGMKYLRLKNERSYHSSDPSDLNVSSDEKLSEETDQ